MPNHTSPSRRRCRASDAQRFLALDLRVRVDRRQDAPPAVVGEPQLDVARPPAWPSRPRRTARGRRRPPGSGGTVACREPSGAPAPGRPSRRPVRRARRAARRPTRRGGGSDAVVVTCTGPVSVRASGSAERPAVLLGHPPAGRVVEPDEARALPEELRDPRVGLVARTGRGVEALELHGDVGRPGRLGDVERRQAVGTQADPAVVRRRPRGEHARVAASGERRRRARRRPSTGGRRAGPRSRRPSTSSGCRRTTSPGRR